MATEITDRQQLLGQGAAAYLVYSAVSQYQVRVSVALKGLDPNHSDWLTLAATAFALETAKKRAERWMNRLFKRLQGDVLASGQHVEKATDLAAVLKFMEEITNLSHLHLEAPLN